MKGAEHSAAPLVLTNSAVARVRELIAMEQADNLKLRVYVTGGGCSGFQYGFDLTRETEEDDSVIDNDGVMVVIDPLSYQYLAGSTVDFETGLMGARFMVQNPNATSTCGCGSSFTI